MLTVRDHTVLQLAFTLSGRRRPRVSLLDLTGYSEPVFWAHVDRLLDDPTAVAAYPVDVARLVRLRERRRAVRTRGFSAA